MTSERAIQEKKQPKKQQERVLPISLNVGQSYPKKLRSPGLIVSPSSEQKQSNTNIAIVYKKQINQIPLGTPMSLALPSLDREGTLEIQQKETKKDGLSTTQKTEKIGKSARYSRSPIKARVLKSISSTIVKTIVRDRNKEIIAANVDKQIKKGFGIGKERNPSDTRKIRLLVPSRKQKGDTKKVTTSNFFFQFKYEKGVVSKRRVVEIQNLSSRLPLFSQSNQLKRNDSPSSYERTINIRRETQKKQRNIISIEVPQG